ncbi:hypothetical protein BASA61_004684 [Batrachochytrium salamandrivorans]|nr:hypothetical protein BASA61_004684 [Batrachochytrium salamandrivorans]
MDLRSHPTMHLPCPSIGPTARPAACQQVCSCNSEDSLQPQFRGGPQQVYPQTNRGMRPPGTSGPGQGFPPMGRYGPSADDPDADAHGAYPAGVPFVPGQPVPGDDAASS